LVESEEKNKNWRQKFEDKNLRILTEISNALKTLKTEMLKEKKGNSEKFENLKDEIISNHLSHEKLIDQLNEQIKKNEVQFEYKLEEHQVKAAEEIRRVLDKLTFEIEVNGNETLEKAKKEIGSSIFELDHKLKSYTDQKIVLLKEDLTKLNRNSIDILKTEIAKDFTAVQLKFVDFQK